MSDRQSMNAVDPSHRRSGIRRTSALAGFTLLATTGAFGAYLGNPRLQRSYAAATCNVATESELNAALASFTANPSTDCTVITLTKNIKLTDDLTHAIGNDGVFSIDGAGHTIDGRGHSGLRVEDAEVTIDRITLRKLTGAVVVVSSVTVIEDSIFEQNTAITYGASAITMVRGSLDVRRSVFTGNSPSAGGPGVGGRPSAGGTGDGAILVYGEGSGTVEVTDSYFADNTSATAGGAITMFFTVNPKIHGTTFARNTAQSGGAIMSFSDSDLEIVNSTFTANVATTGIGGAVGLGATYGSSIDFSTFVGNSAATTGGAVSTFYNVSAMNEVSNSLFWGNTAAHGDDLVVWGLVESYNLVSSPDSIAAGDGQALTPDGTDVVGINPRLAPLRDNGGSPLPRRKHVPTMALRAGSPAINAAAPVTVTPLDDQRGPDYPRVVDGRADIGAFEAQVPRRRGR